MAYYRIKDWSEHFEDHNTRKLKDLRFVLLPNKHDGLGYRRIAALPDGPAVFAAWTLILQVASKGTMAERGSLVRGGETLDADDLAVMTGFDASIFRRAFEVLVHPKIGWLELAEEGQKARDFGDIPEAPGGAGDAGKSAGDAPENIPLNRREGNGIEEKRIPPLPPRGGGDAPESDFPLEAPEPETTVEQRLAVVHGRPLTYRRGKERPPGDDVWAERVEAVWRAAKGGRLRRDQVIGSLCEHVDELGAEEVAARLARYCSEVDGNFATLKRFAETIGDWGAGRKKPPGPEAGDRVARIERIAAKMAEGAA